jgi:four helix bundle protein
MPLQLPHKELDLYLLSKKLLHCCYEVTQDLPVDVRKTLFHEMRRAALFVYLDTSKGLAKDSKKKKKKCYCMAKDQLIIIDAIVEVLAELQYINKDQEKEINEIMTPCYQILTEITNKK